MLLQVLSIFVLCILKHGLQARVADTKYDRVSIVGGHDAKIEDYPYQVTLLRSMNFFCGGILVASNIVLTAAHCCTFTKSLSVRAGSVHSKSGGELKQCNKVVMHPEYNPRNYSHDFCLIKLESSFQLSTTINLAQLEETGRQDDFVGLLASVTGFGYLEFNGENAKQLQVVEVPIVRQEKCSQFYKPRHVGVDESMICAGYDAGGKDSCQGDSGGPLTLNGKIVGVVSWGYGCAFPKYPGVYAFIPSAIDWIKSTMHNMTV